MAELKKGSFSPFRRSLQRWTARHAIIGFHRWTHGIEITGRENVPDGPCIVVGNHLSDFDPPLLCAATDKQMAFLSKKELFSEKAWFTWLIELYGAIPIDREKPEKSTIKSVKKIIKDGWCLGMFIEGTRSRTPGQMGPPHTGTAYFAKSNNVPILPVGILGTNEKGKKVICRIGKPIIASDDLEKTTWEVMESLSELTGHKLPERKLASH